MEYPRSKGRNFKREMDLATLTYFLYFNMVNAKAGHSDQEILTNLT